MADITLAVIPLTMKLLDECLNGYKIFTEAKDLGRNSQKMLWKFRIQETRLRVWAREWGILDNQCATGAIEVRDHYDYKVVSETLLRISELFKDYKQLKNRYGLSLVTDGPTTLVGPGYIEEQSSGDFDDLVSRELANFSRVDTSLQQQRNKTAGFLKKFRWAASDRGKLEAIIHDLRDYNDGLYHLLSSVERRRLRNALAPEIVRTNDRDELLHLQQASDEYSDIPQLVGMRSQKLTYEISSSSMVPWGPASTIAAENLKIPGKEIVLAGSVSSDGTLSQRRSLASYLKAIDGQIVKKDVFVEWKFFEKDVNDSIKQEQLVRLDTLARLLHISSKPKDLRAPHCLGYIVDDWHPRVGFIFECPAPSGNPPSILRTLRHSLGGSIVPYLGDRFRLAYELSISLCLLHIAGWLHKGIRSENIIFLTGAHASPPNLQNPSLLGFEYSRPDNLQTHSDFIKPNELESNLCRHPRAQGPARDRFSRAYDIYALGIVLLEIGFWRPISEFWHDSYNMETFQHDLCGFHAPKLGAKMGQIYMNVVLACLTGRLADTATEENDSQTGFYWEVVHELSRLVA